MTGDASHAASRPVCRPARIVTAHGASGTPGAAGSEGNRVRDHGCDQGTGARAADGVAIAWVTSAQRF